MPSDVGAGMHPQYAREDFLPNRRTSIQLLRAEYFLLACTAKDAAGFLAAGLAKAALEAAEDCLSYIEHVLATDEEQFRTLAPERLPDPRKMASV